MNGLESGKITKREKKLLFYLGNCIADFCEKNKTERSEMLCGFTILCHLMFSKQTPITDKEKKCEEVDAFCECLKIKIRNED
jgi:hypothetical protein